MYFMFSVHLNTFKRI